jgi:putative nucleotidyltransferase with HDIG domain
MTKAELITLVPEVDLISDEKIKEGLAGAIDQMERESGQKIAEFPLGHGITKTGSLLSHSRAIIKMGLAMAEITETFDGNKPNHDYIIAGCLLHDLAVIYQKERRLKHTFTGAFAARDNGLPEAIVAIVANHAKEGELVDRTLEEIIVYHVDFAHLEILTREHWTQVIVK